jgi:hypothetical protein
MKQTPSRLLLSSRNRCGRGGSRTTGRWCRLIAILSLCGCMNAQNTRFPSWTAWFPSAENRAYERQDPFPDPDIGPSTDATPRGYERPRSQTRRAAEQRLFQGIPVGPENVSPGVPQGGLNTDRAVH